MFYYIDHKRLKIVETPVESNKHVLYPNLEGVQYALKKLLENHRVDAQAKEAHLKVLMAEQSRFLSQVQDSLQHMEEVYKVCDECGGSGEVHSHNPRCWGCGGRGIVKVAAPQPSGNATKINLGKVS